MKRSLALFAQPLARLLLRLNLQHYTVSRQRLGIRQLDRGLFCGGAPTEALLQALARQGVRQVVDLRLPHEHDGSEAALCARLGLSYVAVPMQDTLPDFPILERLLPSMAQTPTYLHCRNRSGRGAGGALPYSDPGLEPPPRRHRAPAAWLRSTAPCTCRRYHLLHL